MENKNKKDNKIKFKNEEEGPIQIVLNKKEEIMEEKPLIKKESKGENVKKGESKEENVYKEEQPNKDTTTINTTTYPSSTEEITPLEKVTAFATAIVKAITDGLIKAFVWITELFKRRRRESEREGEVREEVGEEIREENV